MIIEIIGYYKPALLQALVNAASGEALNSEMSFFYQNMPKLSLQQAEKLHAENKRFDYIYGKKMGFSLRESDTELNLTTYIRDNGINAVKIALNTLDKLPKSNSVHLKGFESS
jgi:hypothetical protein